jgi:hypothetical protein
VVHVERVKNYNSAQLVLSRPTRRAIANPNVLTRTLALHTERAPLGQLRRASVGVAVAAAAVLAKVVTVGATRGGSGVGALVVTGMAGVGAVAAAYHRGRLRPYPPPSGAAPHDAGGLGGSSQPSGGAPSSVGGKLGEWLPVRPRL